MNTSHFVQLLKDFPELGLEFQIEEEKTIAPTFHITEIKNVSIESVDCGGRPDSYKETVVQLMVNPEEKIRRPWTASKALSIFKKVDEMKPIEGNTEIFFEYGDETLRTSHYSVSVAETDKDKLTLRLFAKPTVCKPSLGVDAACCGVGANSCC